MSVLVVQHEDGCPPALLGQGLVEAGVDLDVRRAHAGDPLPADLAGHEALVILGGEMGADDDVAYPWLTHTKELVRVAVRDAVLTLGICLGHQLIASALGGTVCRNPRGRQIGVYDVGWTAAASTDQLLSPLATPRRAIHWNEDLVLAPPPGAILLAATPLGEVQAMRFAPTVWGVQWHPEATPDMISSWVDLEPGPRANEGLRAVRDAEAELERSWQDLGKVLAARVA